MTDIEQGERKSIADIKRMYEDIAATNQEVSKSDTNFFQTHHHVKNEEVLNDENVSDNIPKDSNGRKSAFKDKLSLFDTTQKAKIVQKNSIPHKNYVKVIDESTGKYKWVESDKPQEYGYNSQDSKENNYQAEEEIPQNE